MEGEKNRQNKSAGLINGLLLITLSLIWIQTLRHSDLIMKMLIMKKIIKIFPVCKNVTLGLLLSSIDKLCKQF